MPTKNFYVSAVVEFDGKVVSSFEGKSQITPTPVFQLERDEAFQYDVSLIGLKSYWPIIKPRETSERDIIACAAKRATIWYSISEASLYGNEFEFQFEHALVTNLKANQNFVSASRYDFVSSHYARAINNKFSVGRTSKSPIYKGERNGERSRGAPDRAQSYPH
jgi:hypothetical protein